jgi:predicted ATPase
MIETPSNLRFLSALSDLLFVFSNSELIYRDLSKIFSGVRYIAPMRTSTERYYRFQDLSIDEIDHKGTNLAMFLTAIPKKWRDQLNSWTLDNFNFLIKERYAGSNISIEISYGDNDSFDNITDMGFGFSQMLPIIVNLWSVASGYENHKKRNFDKIKSIIFAIEQPELHLHPKMQASLAIIFNKAISLAKNNGIYLSLIIETHSSALISKFGDLVASDELSNENINILLFEQDRSLRKTEIKYSTFDDEGVLDNWPVDFFYS